MSPAGDYPFSLPMQIPAGEKLLHEITVELPDRDLVESYGYSSLGELTNNTKYVHTLSNGFWYTLSNDNYHYGTLSFSDATYTSAQERVIDYLIKHPGGTSNRISFSYTMDGNSSNPSQTRITDIRGITDYNLFSSLYPARSWSDGLVAGVQRKNSDQTKIYRTEATEWEQPLMSRGALTRMKRVFLESLSLCVNSD